MAFGFVTPTCRSFAEVFENLASRDLAALVDSGLLVLKNERRGRSYERSSALAGMVEKFSVREPIVDPFQKLEKQRRE